jgi:hypothetical protein
MLLKQIERCHQLVARGHHLEARHAFAIAGAAAFSRALEVAVASQLDEL